jgi:hypothetical protein
MSKVAGAVATLVIMFAGPSPLRAQTSDSLSQVYTDSSGLVIRSPAPPVEQSAAPVDESKWPDPTITLVKSMLVPGWGQITNKRYIKAALAIGLETWFLTAAIVNNSYASQALDDFQNDPTNLTHYDDYQYYWGQRSDFLWLFGITVFVSMFDAYVDAHLRPYESDNIPGVDPPRGLKIVIPF